ncbi:sensor domain-containing protein [Halobaculum litoreum]|uniref:Sensor domain-containing protein n=1 Tax=Halobaculum litoreum TaxID=3031998 RepID=A0ABD5XQ67_9EURY|nr:sensor domain-containing protein [Halobaculum sp. DT92]
MRTTTTTPRSVAQAFLTAPVRPQTYKNLAYLALQFPLGVAYFVLLVPALGFGLGSLPLLVLLGLPAVGALVVGVATMTVDRAVTAALLPVELERHTAGASLDDGVVVYLTDLLFDPGTYLSVVFVLAKFAVGIATFVVLTVSGTLVAVALAAPFLYDHPDATLTIPLPAAVGGGLVAVDTLPEALAFAALGVVGAVLVVNLWNAIAWLLGEATTLACRHARVLDVGSAVEPDRA